MTITTYKNLSANNVIKKSLTSANEKTVDIYEGVNILNPILIFNGYLDEDINYCYIPKFGRYYYVKKTFENGLTTLTCKVDVLKSYQGELLSTNCLIERTSSDLQRYRQDILPVYVPKRIKTKEFSKHFPSSDNLILVVNGGN